MATRPGPVADSISVRELSLSGIELFGSPLVRDRCAVTGREPIGRQDVRQTGDPVDQRPRTSLRARPSHRTGSQRCGKAVPVPCFRSPGRV